MRLKIKTQYYNAITLTETVVYIALFAVLFLIIISFSVNVGDLNSSAYANNNATISEVFVTEHLNTRIGNSVSIDADNSVFHSDNGVLRLNQASGYYEYSLVDNQLKFFDGTDSSLVIPPSFRVSRFVVEPVETSDSTLIGVRISVEFNTSDSKITKSSQSLYTITP